MNERPILVTVFGAGAVLAGAFSIPRSDRTESIARAAADRILSETRDEPVPPPRLETAEKPPREGRQPACEIRPASANEAARSTRSESRTVPKSAPEPFPTDPVALSNLPESTWSEMTYKRDAIEKHLSRLPRSKDPEHLSFREEVGRLNSAIQERAIADYWERRAELAAGR